MGIISPIMPIYAQGMGATGLWLGLIFSSFAIGRFIFTPAIGRMSDIHGRKLLLITGLGAYTALSYAYVLAGNPLELTVFRFLHGIASAMVLPLAFAYVSEMSPARQEGKHLSIFNISFTLGFGLGPFLGGYLADEYGFASAFYGMTALSALALALSLMFIPRSSNMKVASRTLIVGFWTLGRIVTALSIYNMLSFLGRGIIMTFLAIYAISINLTIAEVGIVLTVGMLTMIPFQIFFGQLADRYSKVQLMILGAGISAVSISLLPYAESFLSLLALNMILGVGGAIAYPAALAIGAQIGKNVGFGSVMGSLDSGTSLGVAIGPVVAGLIFDYIGLPAVFLFGGLAGAAAVAPILMTLKNMKAT